jgi:histidine triad (HIT) family protein
MDCPFCDSKIIEEQSIYENKNVWVLYNIRPANKGQCVVVPKRHVSNIRELAQGELVDLILAVQLVSQKYKEYLKPTGFNYGFNEGQYAGQTIEHFHFHIMPRVEGDKNKLPEYHLFHRDPKTKKDMSFDELKLCVSDIKKLFFK